MKKHIRTSDFEWKLFFATILLIIIGLFMLYSATRTENFRPERNLVAFQSVWVFIALILLGLITGMPFRLLLALCYPLYIIGIFLLIITLLWGKEVGGSRSWIDLGFIPQFQPSEFMKIATVLAISRYLADKKRGIERLQDCIVPIIMLIVPVLLILRQPDLGTAMVLSVVLLPMLYWNGFPGMWIFMIFAPIISMILAPGVLPGSSTTIWVFFLLGVVVVLYWRKFSIFNTGLIFIINLSCGVLASVLFSGLKQYQQIRILGFLNPEKYYDTSGYQLIQSKIAIGSGGFFGKGYLKGWYTKLGFLPVLHNDFIFCVVSEEWGLIGGLVLLLLYGIIIFRSISLAAEVKNKFASLACVGFAFIFVVHVVYNTGMTIGLFPITGIPLPFISYGGSSLLTNTIMIGLMLNFGLNRYEY